MLVKAIIVDDEPLGRKNLAGVVKEYCPEVELLGEASSVDEAILLINNFKPNLVFLDIEMPGANGFALLEHFKEFNFEVIFVTAYGDYALKAIRFSAADYILKPINHNELKKAVGKVSERIRLKTENAHLRNLYQNFQRPQHAKIGLPTSDRIEFVEVDRILYCQSDGSYTHLFLDGNKQFMVSKNIGEFEDLLQEHSFIRAHKTYLVNLNHVQAFLKIDGGAVQMTDEKIIPVSRRRKEAVVARLKEITNT